MVDLLIFGDQQPWENEPSPIASLRSGRERKKAVSEFLSSCEEALEEPVEVVSSIMAPAPSFEWDTVFYSGYPATEDPAHSYLETTYQHRFLHHASFACPELEQPQIGTAGTPYARTVRPNLTSPSINPNPGDIFDAHFDSKQVYVSHQDSLGIHPLELTATQHDLPSLDVHAFDMQSPHFSPSPYFSPSQCRPSFSSQYPREIDNDEQKTEADRHAWLHDRSNETLNLPTDHRKAAVLTLKRRDDVNEYNRDHNSEVSKGR